MSCSLALTDWLTDRQTADELRIDKQWAEVESGHCLLSTSLHRSASILLMHSFLPFSSVTFGALSLKKMNMLSLVPPSAIKTFWKLRAPFLLYHKVILQISQQVQPNNMTVLAGKSFVYGDILQSSCGNAFVMLINLFYFNDVTLKILISSCNMFNCFEIQFFHFLSRAV